MHCVNLTATCDMASWTNQLSRRLSGGGDSLETDLAKKFSGRRRGSLPTELRPRGLNLLNF